MVLRPIGKRSDEVGQTSFVGITIVDHEPDGQVQLLSPRQVRRRPEQRINRDCAVFGRRPRPTTDRGVEKYRYPCPVAPGDQAGSINPVSVLRGDLVGIGSIRRIQERSTINNSQSLDQTDPKIGVSCRANSDVPLAMV